MKNIIFFSLYLLLNPRLLKLFFQNIYVPVYIQCEWLKKIKINCVIDVGAYRGHVSKVFNHLFPEAEIFAFEPSDEILKMKKNDNITMVRLAVGDRVGTSNLYETSFRPASSLLHFGSFYNGIFKMINKKKINVTTLDVYFKNKKFRKHTLLKIDTQGMEGAVLRGAENILKYVSIIHVESPLEELYRGQDFFEDIYLFLTKRHFRYIGDIPDSLFMPRFNPPEVLNCIYINTKLLNLNEK